MVPSSISANSWIIETGTTYHIIHPYDMFTSITKTLNTSIKLPNRDTVAISHLGTIQISKKLLLKDVLCLPSFAYNLLSVNILTSSQKCFFIFLSENCYIQEITPWRMIGIAKRVARLYILQKLGVNIDKDLIN